MFVSRLTIGPVLVLYILYMLECLGTCHSHRQPPRPAGFKKVGQERVNDCQARRDAKCLMYADGFVWAGTEQTAVAQAQRQWLEARKQQCSKMQAMAYARCNTQLGEDRVRREKNSPHHQSRTSVRPRRAGVRLRNNAKHGRRLAIEKQQTSRSNGRKGSSFLQRSISSNGNDGTCLEP